LDAAHGKGIRPPLTKRQRLNFRGQKAQAAGTPLTGLIRRGWPGV